MKLVCIGSGSSGNCYLLDNGEECLVIEQGVPFKEVKRYLDFDISRIVGGVVSHIHNDHHGHSHEYEEAGIPILKPFETTEDIANLGGFRVQKFPLVHSVDCYGFFITHLELGKMVFVSDTQYVPQNFYNIGLNHILCEANYSPELIDSEQASYNHSLTGHMSIDTAIDFVMHNTTDALRTVTFCHLSKRNADADMFLQRLNDAVPEGVKTAIATKGMEIDLSC